MLNSKLVYQYFIISAAFVQRKFPINNSIFVFFSNSFIKCNRSRSMAFYLRINFLAHHYCFIVKLHRIFQRVKFGEIFGDLWTRHVRSSESDGFSLGRVQRGRFTCFAADDKERLVTRSEQTYEEKKKILRERIP